jgi:hypothetical protein
MFYDFLNVTLGTDASPEGVGASINGSIVVGGLA